MSTFLYEVDRRNNCKIHRNLKQSLTSCNTFCHGNDFRLKEDVVSRLMGSALPLKNSVQRLASVHNDPADPRVQLDLHGGRPSHSGQDAHLVDRLRQDGDTWRRQPLETVPAQVTPVYPMVEKTSPPPPHPREKYIFPHPTIHQCLLLKHLFCLYFYMLYIFCTIYFQVPFSLSSFFFPLHIEDGFW